MMQPHTCPYCNARFPSESATVCPRCGERRPGATTAEEQPLGGRSDGAAGRGWRIAALLAVVGVGVLGVWWLLPGPVTPPPTNALQPPTPDRALAPANWPGLHWLREGTDIVAGLHVARSAELPVTTPLLGKLGLDTTEMAGLPRDEIERVLVGVDLDGPVPPPILVVVRTRRPYDARAVRLALRAETIPGQKIERTRSERAPGREGALYLADERTLLLSSSLRDLETIADQPADGPVRLAPALLETLGERLTPEAVAWAAIHTPAGPPPWLGLVLTATNLPLQDADALVKLTDLAANIRPGEPATVEVAVRGVDEQATETLGGLLPGRLPALGWTTSRRGRVGEWYAVTARPLEP